jgi:hypothetical protein
LALQSAIEGVFDDRGEGCRRSGVTGQQYWMAPLDRRYDHAAADGAPRSLRPEEATGVGQIVTIVIELAAGAVRSGLKHNTRQTRSEAGTVSQSEFMPP